MNVPHSCSDIDEADRLAVQQALLQNFVGYGPASRALEEWYRQRTGRRHAFAVQSGSQALLLALLALDLPAASKVGMPVLTCKSVHNAVMEAGLVPALADILAADLTFDIPAARGDWAAMVVPHAYGAAARLDRAAALGIPWIEDCATSPATTWDGAPVGRAGTLSVFSFNSTKYVTGGCGGMLLTDRADCADAIETLLAAQTGRAARMPALNAALALAQSMRMNEFLAHRRLVAAAYDAALAPYVGRGVHLPPAHPSHSYYRYIVRVPFAAAPAVAQLQAQGIDARASVNDWLDRDGRQRESDTGLFPAAGAWRDNLLSLPIHMQVTEEIAHRTAGMLIACIEQH